MTNDAQNNDSAVQAGQFVTLASGLRLHYAKAGRKDQPLAIFIHGFPQAWFAWEDQLGESASQRFCVAPDLRGFNLSDKPAAVKEYRIDRLVNDIAELIDALGYKEADLIAHDWGGAVAWSVAIARPEIVRKLLIINAPHPVTFARALGNDKAQQDASQYMLELREPSAEARLLADDCAYLLSRFESKHDAWLTPEVANRYRQAWCQPGAMSGALSYYRASPLMPPSPDHPGASALTLDADQFRVTMPTTVLWAMDDHALLPVLLEGLEDLVPQLSLKKIDDASHWVLHEKPQLIADQIQQFLGADSGH